MNTMTTGISGTIENIKTTRQTIKSIFLVFLFVMIPKSVTQPVTCDECNYNWNDWDNRKC